MVAEIQTAKSERWRDFVGVWKKRSKIHAHINFVILNFTLKMSIMLLFAVSRNYPLWQSNESCVASCLGDVRGRVRGTFTGYNFCTCSAVQPTYTSRTKLWFRSKQKSLKIEKSRKTFLDHVTVSELYLSLMVSVSRGLFYWFQGALGCALNEWNSFYFAE